MPLRTFVVFETAPSAQDAVALLGSLVIVPERPNAGYVPPIDRSDLKKEDSKTKGQGQVVSHPVPEAPPATSEVKILPTWMGRNRVPPSVKAMPTADTEKQDKPDENPATPTSQFAAAPGNDEHGQPNPDTSSDHDPPKPHVGSGPDMPTKGTGTEGKLGNHVSGAAGDDQSTTRADSKGDNGHGSTGPESPEVNTTPSREEPKPESFNPYLDGAAIAAGGEPGNTPNDKGHSKEKASVEANSMSFLESHTLEIVPEENVEITAKTMKSATLQARMTQLFTLGISSKREESFFLKSDLVKTHALEQYGDVWNQVNAAYSKEIDDLMDLHKTNKAYMMVTLKTALKPNIQRKQTKGGSFDGSLTIPIDKLAGAPTSMADLKLLAKYNSTQKAAAKSVASGEIAFAAEYCEIVRTAKYTFKLATVVQKEKAELKMKKTGVMSAKPKQLAFADREKKGAESAEAIKDVYVENLD
ncbi:hypothetical protein MHUMG1_10607 [Metarhizium humberi]|uniref:Uncharacterized protein n=1 Tax=Metarhizium humberi TaxID=2596975 RepID=A0A9P8S2E7_9HYPO|nr:hypothetical protein MHUMG1_10607 [Metarhizium humberi]